ncbi:MAG: hypothetical protein ACHP85_02815 [Burkholderiales bacterium]|jgi:hypothetical protein
MTDTRFLPGLALVAVVAAAVLVALLALGLMRPGARRAGLVAGGLPLALLPTVAATAYVSWKLIGLFAAMGETGGGTMQQLLDACASLWLIARVGWGAFAVACVLGLLLAFLRSGPSPGDAACSARRGFVLVLLPVLGLLIASTVTHHVGRALRITAAVVSSVENDPASKKRSDAALAAEGLATEGSGSLAAISGFIAREAMIGTFGGATAAVILLGLAAPGAILAWRVQFGSSFLAIAAALWLLAAALGGLVAGGFLNPLRLA